MMPSPVISTIILKDLMQLAAEATTDAFKKFIIEFGNENWHNRKIQDFLGFGRKN